MNLHETQGGCVETMASTRKPNCKKSTMNQTSFYVERDGARRNSLGVKHREKDCELGIKKSNKIDVLHKLLEVRPVFDNFDIHIKIL